MNKPVAFADGLESLTASLGTARDKATSVTYVETHIGDQQLTAAYKTSWLAKKIVDVPASDTFRRWRNWQAEEDQVEKLEELEKKLGIKEKLVRATKLARLYGSCYIYYDLGDDQSLPLDPTKVKRGGIRFATVLTHRQLNPGEIEQDALSDQFGKPKWFDVVGTTAAGIVRIHPSRIIILIGSESPDENLMVGSREGMGFRLGTSVLSATLPAIKHFDSVAANIASLVFEAKIDVIRVKGLMQIAGNPHEEQKLLARYALAATTKGNNGMLILDGDMEEYEQKAYSFAALPDIMDRFSQNASGAADVPLSRLFGKAHSGIGTSGAGENDTRNYYDHLSASQELTVTPAMATFDECLIYAALGSRPPEVHYLWASLWQNNDKERSELGRIGVATIKTLKDTGLIPDEVLSRGAVNMLTQAGVIPGLEAEYKGYFEKGGEDPWDAEDEGEDGKAEALVPPEKSKPGKPGVLTDAQARDPKGTSTGGQFSSGGASGSINGSPIKSVSSKELKSLVLSGAGRDVIDSHIALLSIIDEMEKREQTTEKPGYGSQEWHENRTYKVDGKDIKGTEAAMEAWETQANELAWKEIGLPVEPILYERELTILLGPPAAGKSTIANEIAVSRKAMILDSDEIKKSIPEFERGSGAAAVHEESSSLAKSLQALAIAKGSNVILPKVGDNPTSIKKTIDLYKAAGYTVSVVNMSVTPENAYGRNISRFVNTGRLVPPSYLDFVGSKPSSTYGFLKLNNMADGFADLDNNGGITDPKPILSQQGLNPLRGTRFAAQMN